MKQKRISSLLLLISVTLLFESLQIGETYREKIDLNKDWEFTFYEQDLTQKVDIPHDYAIIQKFTTNGEAESGFFPGGNAFYLKKFTLKKEILPTSTAILYFYGVYKDALVTVNGHKVGENHYGYNSFAFDVSNYLNFGDNAKNEISVQVENQLFNSRWYSGSGLFRGVFLMITNPIHIALDGIKVTTPQVKDTEQGTAAIETIIMNNDKDMEIKEVKLLYRIKNKEGEIISNFLSKEIQLKPGENLIKEKINVNNIRLWSDKDPYLYTLDIEIISSENISLDKYSTRFGFRIFSFDSERGFVINGKPTKLHGVCLHHDYGALGSIDNYDAAYRRFVQLKEMGINALRTSHNPAYRTWIELCDELGIYVIEEFFDTWNLSKGQNNHDFHEYFNVAITDDNEILGKKPGMTWPEYVIKSTIRRDQNSPSIIMWSIGNEIGVKSGSDDIGRNLIKWGQELDLSRPYTRGDNAFRYKNQVQLAINSEIAKSGGVVGYNYARLGELKDGANMYGAIYLSESASALNSRSVYSTVDNTFFTKKDDGKYHLTSYDVSYASWSTPAYYSLRLTLSQDYNAGQFVWTGLDYIGEPTPYNKETAGSQTGKGAYPNSAYFGIIDTCGFPKDSYYLYRSQLIKDSTTVHLVTAWDINNMYFVNKDKKTTPVHLYSNAATIEIFRDDINTPICVSQKVPVKTQAGYEYHTYNVISNNRICEPVAPSNNDLLFGTDLFSRYNIEFKEGTTLYTKAYDDNGEIIDKNKIVGNYKIKAPNLNKLKLEVKVDKNTIKAEKTSLAYIEVSIIDDEGFLNTKAENSIMFSLSGPGKILGVDNGDQATIDKFQQSQVLSSPELANIKAYAGKALAIISSNGEKGTIRLEVSSNGLNGTVIEINTEK